MYSLEHIGLTSLHDNNESLRYMVFIMYKICIYTAILSVGSEL